MRNHLLAIGLTCLAVAAMAARTSPSEDYTSPEWKEEIARGYLPYRKLALDDFPVSDKSSSPHWMHTEGFAHYTYKATWRQTDGLATAKVSEITIRSGFDQNKSWQKSFARPDQALLVHEQGHLDINELHAMEFRNLKPLPIAKGPTGQAAMDDLQTKVRTAFEKILKASQDEQDQYDLETNHGAKQAEQRRWNALLRRELDDQKITYWDKAG